DLTNLRRSERIKVASAQVGVVGADDDVLVGLARQVPEHIVHRGPCAFDVHSERNMQLAGKFERAGVRGSIDQILDAGERLPCCCEPGFCHRILDLYEDYAGILRSAEASESR